MGHRGKEIRLGLIGRLGFSGRDLKTFIQIHCVENVEEQYKKVKELIDNGSQDE